MLQILEQGVISRDSNRAAFMPVITPLSSGEWLACQHVGTALASPDNDIAFGAVPYLASFFIFPLSNFRLPERGKISVGRQPSLRRQK